MSRFDSVTIRPGQRNDDITPGRRVVIRLKSTVDLINQLEPDKVYCPAMGGYIGINIRHHDADGQIKEVLMRRWTGSAWRTFRPGFLDGGPDLAQFLSEAVPDTGKLDEIYHVLQPDIVPQEYGHIFIDFTQSPIRVFSHNVYTQWGDLGATTTSGVWLLEMGDIYYWLNNDIECIGDFHTWEDGRKKLETWNIKSKTLLPNQPRFGRRFYYYVVDKHEVYERLKPYADLLADAEETEKRYHAKDEEIVQRVNELYKLWRPLSLFMAPLTQKVAIVDNQSERPTLKVVQKWMIENGWTSPINLTAWAEYENRMIEADEATDAASEEAEEAAESFRDAED